VTAGRLWTTTCDPDLVSDVRLVKIGMPAQLFVNFSKYISRSSVSHFSSYVICRETDRAILTGAAQGWRRVEESLGDLCSPKVCRLLCVECLVGYNCKGSSR
jgi:hypothetical protein